MTSRHPLKRPASISYERKSTEIIQKIDSTHGQKKRRYNNEVITTTSNRSTIADTDVNANSATTTSHGCSKKKKRFLWSNALHMRFLMAMFDWSMKNIDAKKLSMHLADEPDITSTINVKDIETYLKALREGLKLPREIAVQKCEEEIKKDYAILPFVPKLGMITNFTEYPLKVRYRSMIENDIPILKPMPEESIIEEKKKIGQQQQIMIHHRSQKKHNKAWKLRDNKIRKSNKEQRDGAIDGSILQPNANNHKTFNDYIEELFDEPTSPSWSDVNDNNSRKLTNISRDRGNSFNLDDVFTSTEVEEFGIQYKLHREMMRRHAENIIRYGGYAKLPTDAKVLEDSISTNWDDLDIPHNIGSTTLGISADSASTISKDKHISRDDVNRNFYSDNVHDSFRNRSSSTNSLRIGGSPGINASDFSIVTEDEDGGDDNLFAFLLDD
eukprot:g9298.t1